MSRFSPRRRRGAAMIEFAFWLPIIIVMLSGLLDFSWYMSNAQNVMQAARDGARSGAAENDDPTTPGDEVQLGAIEATNWVNAVAPYGCAPTTVTQFQQGGLDALTVTVSCTYKPLMGVFNTAPFLPNDIVSEFTMYAEVQ